MEKALNAAEAETHLLHLLSEVEHGARIAWDHDPFDRIIAAQALIRGLTLVSVDRVFIDLPGVQLLEEP